MSDKNHRLTMTRILKTGIERQKQKAASSLDMTIPLPSLTLLLQITSTNGTTALDALEAAALELKAFRFPEPGWYRQTEFYTIKALPVEEAGGESAVPREVPSSPSSASILSEASILISGPRRDSYGDVHESFARVAAVWTALLNHPVTPTQVALLMTAFKLCREAHRPGHDNRVDICGYTALMDQLLQPLSTPPST